MSTAALASARRRRTTNEPPVASQNVSTKTTPQDSPTGSKQPLLPPQSLTPLQILQLHDNKLKDLETLVIELNSEEYITNVVEEKITELMSAKLATFSNELDKVRSSTPHSSTHTESFETKLQMLETSIHTNSTIQNVMIDEFKKGIQENFNTFKDNTIKMIELVNIKENHSSIKPASFDLEKIDTLIKELNDLKLMVIKNQTLALETCTSIINMKDEFKASNEKIEEIIDKISDSNSGHGQCNVQQCNQMPYDPTQMFLQSFMKNKFFGETGKINIDTRYDDEDYDEDTDENNMNSDRKKLHIDLTNEQPVLDDEEIIIEDDKIIFNSQELIIDENQLQDILELNNMEEITLNTAQATQETDNEEKNKP
jgi:hypothetical protein